MQYVFGAYTLDVQREELWVAGSAVRLDRQVFAVLAYLVQHRDRVVRRQELFERLWSDRFVSDAALERCVTVARRAVGDSGQTQQVIQTLRGRGYRFVAPVEARPGEASHREVWAAPDDASGLHEERWSAGPDPQEAEWAKAFQRASSAVEGRNGYLSQMHPNHRGLPKRRYKVWTVLHNFDCRISDGTTPASRFFRQEFPDLFETVLLQIDDVPRPRRRH